MLKEKVKISNYYCDKCMVKVDDNGKCPECGKQSICFICGKKAKISGGRCKECWDNVIRCPKCEYPIDLCCCKLKVNRNDTKKEM